MEDVFDSRIYSQSVRARWSLRTICRWHLWFGGVYNSDLVLCPVHILVFKERLSSLVFCLPHCEDPFVCGPTYARRLHIRAPCNTYEAWAMPQYVFVRILHMSCNIEGFKLNASPRWYAHLVGSKWLLWIKFQVENPAVQTCEYFSCQRSRTRGACQISSSNFTLHILRNMHGSHRSDHTGSWGLFNLLRMGVTRWGHHHSSSVPRCDKVWKTMR